MMTKVNGAGRLVVLNGNLSTHITRATAKTMKFRTLIGLLVLLSVVGRRGCSAQTNPCYGAGQRPLVNENAGNITGYSYTVDKAPPYKGSHERYAHERFLL